MAARTLLMEVRLRRWKATHLRPCLMLIFLLAALLLIVSIWELWRVATAPLGGE
jgi:hypothetical protein